ncbi:LOW QUALITY PROTEIN: hypothetical protein Dda_4811 [Drechslerella dactyloides]|uniref:Uncharacterized protein n=1 Tax=Drechslerella dactyloides TaxID=74499 RepID=A0AAD6IXL5_DREDA|nr:LOW QUALITY PROTEIN: hypothetical protein Dda_4811 [Drechslerella dactyloides]
MRGNMLPACVALAHVMGSTLVVAAPLAQVDECGVPQVPNIYKRDADAQSGLAAADIASSSTGRLQKRGLFSILTGILGKNCSTKSARQDAQGLPREQGPTGQTQRQEIAREEDDNIVVSFNDPVVVENTGMNYNPNNQDMNQAPFPMGDSGNPFVPSSNAIQFYREPNLFDSVDSTAENPIVLQNPVQNPVQNQRSRRPNIGTIDLRDPEEMQAQLRENARENIREQAPPLKSPRRGIRQFFSDTFSRSRSKSPINTGNSGGMSGDMNVASYSGTPINRNPNPVANLDVGTGMNAGIPNPLPQQRGRPRNPVYPINLASESIVTDRLLPGLETNPELDAIRGPTRLAIPVGNARSNAWDRAWREAYGEDTEVTFPQGASGIDLSQIQQNYLRPDLAADANANPVVEAGSLVNPNANVIAEAVNAELANTNILPADINDEIVNPENILIGDNAANGNQGQVVESEVIQEVVQEEIADPNSQAANGGSVYESFDDVRSVNPNQTGDFGNLGESVNLGGSQILPGLLASQVLGGGPQQGGVSNVPTTIVEEDRESIRSEFYPENAEDSRDWEEFQDALSEPDTNAQTIAVAPVGGQQQGAGAPAGGQLQNLAQDQLNFSFAPELTIPAPNAASVVVFSKTSKKCSGLPAPLEAITGSFTTLFTSLINSRSNPEFVPSLSIQFNKISPHPIASTATTNSCTSISRPSRPPLIVHWYQQYCSPLGPENAVLIYSSAARTASLPIETLSAPDLKYIVATWSAETEVPSASITSRIPPPIVSGTNTDSDVSRRTSSMGVSATGQF